ncbi:hypothetical protein N7495_002566, partial [Penicillium taxi]|uniref:uncharacterized protein n=1 Tax=Penicillium taxi TaxID=168475 RepID=UPI0025452D00
MTRPPMIRADTMDLQDHDSPSAQDHSKHPEESVPLGSGRPATHQEQTIRTVNQESQSEAQNGPPMHNDPEHRDGMDEYQDEETDEIKENSQYDHEDSDLVDGDDDLDDDMMDKISSSPSIDDEDIDFEFVYALHNFVATVDGQANAAKGDTMVLLDDSNSYWWLVRVVKDGSIGYLPAEHIETPTERLARLNKHRNVDLSATMLGDNSEKSKNPLKKAMRRRNTKNVNFAPPTYIEASDVEYSTDEDDSEHGDFFNDDETETVESEEGDGQDQNEDIVVEPLRPKGNKLAEQPEVHAPERNEPVRSSSEGRRSNEDPFSDDAEPTVKKSRNGTVRNTDSFFKDDTAEPKKISLTPNLLRDESTSNSTLSEWKEGRGSFEADKASPPQDKSKDDKKRKDKKPGMLSGLFKRKDKKSKAADDEGDEFITSPTSPTSPTQSAFRASPQPKVSMESIESRTARSPRQAGNKLQKQQQTPITPTSPTAEPKDYDTTQTIRKVTSHSSSLEETRRAVTSPSNYQDSSKGSSKESFTTTHESREQVISPVDRPSSEAKWRGPHGPTDGSSERLQNGKISVTIPAQKFGPKLVAREIEPEPELEPQPEPQPEPQHESEAEPQHEPESEHELPVDDVSPVEGHIPLTNFPPSSPETDMHETKGSLTTPGSADNLSVDTPTWSDASLRSYMDEENDIRDLYVLVHDKSNIPPAGPDHPVTGRLFKEESRRLKEMNNQLDDLLVNWMSQRNRHGT